MLIYISAKRFTASFASLNETHRCDRYLTPPLPSLFKEWREEPCRGRVCVVSVTPGCKTGQREDETSSVYTVYFQQAAVSKLLM